MELLAMIVSTSSTFAIFLNLAVIYIILKFSSRIGKYKWVLAGYAAYEAFYSLLIVVVVPTHLVYDNTWIIIANSPRFEGTVISHYGTGFYCGVQLVWLAITLFQFIYRYMVICQPNFMVKVNHSSILRFILISLAAGYSLYLFTCGTYWCRQAEVSQAMKDQLLIHYNIVDINRYGYMLMRLVDNRGGFSFFGTLSTVNHFSSLAAAGAVVIFCSTCIYSEFKRHARGVGVVENIKKQRQLFRLLVAQSALPLFCVSIPGTFYATFPVWHPNWSFGFGSPIMTMVLTIPKFFDPIVTVLLITDYRQAFMNIILGRGNKEDTTRNSWAMRTTTRKPNSQST